MLDVRKAGLPEPVRCLPQSVVAPVRGCDPLNQVEQCRPSGRRPVIIQELGLNNDPPTGINHRVTPFEEEQPCR